MWVWYCLRTPLRFSYSIRRRGQQSGYLCYHTVIKVGVVSLRGGGMFARGALAANCEGLRGQRARSGEPSRVFAPRLNNGPARTNCAHTHGHFFLLTLSFSSAVRPSIVRGHIRPQYKVKQWSNRVSPIRAYRQRGVHGPTQRQTEGSWLAGSLQDSQQLNVGHSMGKFAVLSSSMVILYLMVKRADSMKFIGSQQPYRYRMESGKISGPNQSASSTSVLYCLCRSANSLG